MYQSQKAFSPVIHSPHLLAHDSTKQAVYGTPLSRLRFSKDGKLLQITEMIQMIRYSGPSTKDCIECPYSCTLSFSVYSLSPRGVKMNSPRLIPSDLSHLVSTAHLYDLCGWPAYARNTKAPIIVCSIPHVH